jgi:alkanesulfonate monooxygenase SsuD/methylene tetrahydromethanopterin reductase-like flavin-dependent oxidoreductase (luciferase family)
VLGWDERLQTETSQSREQGLEVGIVLREADLGRWRDRLSVLTAAVAAAGIDHITVGDHVSFAGGHGADGLIQAAALLATHPTLALQTGVYLLGLRHPATVARQLATISLIAPGRFTFGVGVGGDDPRELELCGVDPRTRGARTTEALELVRRFMTGDQITFHGRFFDVRQAAIQPPPDPPIPVLIGGRSDAALQRAGRLGDGWLALWVSPGRFTAGTDLVQASAERAGRIGVSWRHTLQLWAALDETRERAVSRISPVFERSYGLPFERFERYTPCGRPEDVAAALAPYLDAGCRRLNFVPEAEGLDAAIEAIATVKRLLALSVTVGPRGPGASIAAETPPRPPERVYPN